MNLPSIQGWIGNTRLSNPLAVACSLRPSGSHPRGRVAVYGPPCNCARRYAPASLRLLGSGVGGRHPCPRGPRSPARPPLLDRPGLVAPVASPPPRETTHTGYFFGYRICCGCLRYDTGPVSAALRPREPASLLCAIKRLSLLCGWINYLPHFQLRNPCSRFVDSSQHLIQIFVMLTCFSVDKPSDGGLGQVNLPSIQGWIGNTRLSNPWQSLSAPYALRAPHPAAVAVYGPPVTARAVTLPLHPLARVWRRGTAPLLRGDPLARSAPTPGPSGARRPRRFRPPAGDYTLRVTFGYRICCGCLRYDTGPVSAALRPREPASLLCAIKRLSLLCGWINYLPHFQLRNPCSRFVDSFSTSDSNLRNAHLFLC